MRYTITSANQTVTEIVNYVRFSWSKSHLKMYQSIGDLLWFQIKSMIENATG